MRILIACETSGVIRRAFAELGHFVVSCDLLPAEDYETGTLGTDQEYQNIRARGVHYQGDVFDLVEGDAMGYMEGGGFDLMIAHPPCTYLCSSGLHWNKRIPGREEKTEQALEFVRRLWALPIDKICIENPRGCIRSRGAIPVKAQEIQPYQFGEDASKATCLFLKNLPILRHTEYIEPRIVNGKPRWSNQTDSGQNRLGPSPDRWKMRARTYEGIASAMAEQWG